MNKLVLGFLVAFSWILLHKNHVKGDEPPTPSTALPTLQAWSKILGLNVDLQRLNLTSTRGGDNGEIEKETATSQQRNLSILSNDDNGIGFGGLLWQNSSSSNLHKRQTRIMHISAIVVTFVILSTVLNLEVQSRVFEPPYNHTVKRSPESDKHHHQHAVSARSRERVDVPILGSIVQQPPVISVVTEQQQQQTSAVKGTSLGSQDGRGEEITDPLKSEIIAHEVERVFETGRTFYEAFADKPIEAIGLRRLTVTKRTSRPHTASRKRHEDVEVSENESVIELLRDTAVGLFQSVVGLFRRRPESRARIKEEPTMTDIANKWDQKLKSFWQGIFGWNRQPSVEPED
ncbi:hypothetical protein Trydic_g5256 [Trypoxylus dichotomus]